MKLQLINKTVINFSEKNVIRKGKVIELPKTDWRILEMLASDTHINKSVTVAEIIHYVYHGEDISPISLDQRIFHIRKAIGKGALITKGNSRVLRSAEGKTHVEKAADEFKAILHNNLTWVIAGFSVILGILIGFIISFSFVEPIQEVIVELNCQDLLQLINQ